MHHTESAIGRRRRYSLAFKRQVVEETGDDSSGSSGASLAGCFHLKPKQYAAASYAGALSRCAIEPSMSRRGNCWDNAPMERLSRSFKSEWMPRRGYNSITAA